MMTMFAASGLNSSIPELSGPSAGTMSQFKQFGIILAASFGVALIVVLVIRFSRRKSPGLNQGGRRRRGGGRRREKFTSRNPTRAETGGLPPVRPEFENEDGSKE